MAFAKFAFTALVVAYPIIVYFGLNHLEARTLAIVIIGLAISRLVLVKRVEGWAEKMPQTKLVVVALLAICTFVIFSNSPDILRYYPVFMNIIMFTIFFTSILHPPTVVEKIARLQTPDLPEAGIRYTRKVTMVWCGFFVVNGTVALYTSVGANLEVWATYNGLISYLIMGILFGGEYIIRRRVKPHASN